MKNEHSGSVRFRVVTDNPNMDRIMAEKSAMAQATFEKYGFPKELIAQAQARAKSQAQKSKPQARRRRRKSVTKK
jgi:hypothetical protein